MIITNTLSTFVKNKLRQIKIRAFGKSDIREAHQIGPFGEDSNPVKNMQAIYSTTSNLAEPVIIGYINKDNIAGIGEKRIFSTNESGELSFYIHMKNDGNCEINGSDDNLVRYSKMNDSMQDFRAKVNAELLKIQTAITGLGGVYTYAATSIDPSDAKIQNIKTTKQD